MKKYNNDNRIPITIGVIGNRDAIITKEIIAKIENLFDDIEKKYPNNPVVLFSQLAIGADTEVAKIFIKIKEEKQRNYNLIVPLPYNIESYKTKQFIKTSDLDTFLELSSKSERVFVLENNSNLQEDKLLYRQSGKFVADSSIILIALWDEKVYEPKEKYIGGTYEIVDYKIKGTFYNEVNNQIFDLDGSLISYNCKRNKEIDGELYKFKKGQKFENLEGILKDKSIKKTLNKIIEFNDITVFNEKNNNQIDRLKQIRKIISIKTRYQQKKYKKNIFQLFVLGFIFFVLFEIYKHLNLLNLVFTFIGITIIYGFFKSYKFSEDKNHFNYIEGRVLSEALRVQIFWNLSDLNRNVSNYILRIHKLEYNWVRHILNSIYGLTYDISKTRHKKIQDVHRDWIIYQKNWFIEKLEENKNIERRYIFWSNVFFGMGIVGLIILFIFKLCNPELFNIEPTEFPLSAKYLHIKELEHDTHLFIIVDSILFGLSAVLKAYVEKKGYGQIRSQYRMSRNIFETTDNKMNNILNDDMINTKDKEIELDRLLYLAGKEALIETGNWYLIMKEKHPEFDPR